jgi:arylamine N-acetyltransferase
VSLREMPLGYWRFSEQAAGGEPFSFDFRVGPADETLFARKCAYLQTDPMSGFVQTLVVQRRTADTHVSLRGRVLSIYRTTGVDKTLLHSGEELVDTLRDRFDLDVPEASTLWPRILARLDEVFKPPGD